jgi:hypothetical protein
VFELWLWLQLLLMFSQWVLFRHPDLSSGRSFR